MNIKNVNLREILNFRELEKLFKNYSKTSGLDVSLYDLSGAEQLSVRGDRSLCELMRGSCVCREKIEQSGRKADELKSSYIYETPCGLVMCIAAVRNPWGSWSGAEDGIVNIPMSDLVARSINFQVIRPGRAGTGEWGPVGTRKPYEIPLLPAAVRAVDDANFYQRMQEGIH